ncbi:MAG: flagellin [Gemmatimonadetes bacterium]|nr:flagellin [Gemmatimonadota bacterium]MCB9518981.1 flagellin [Gemmatimonadales bacterium]MCA9762027.1 flagellin [Gemmatimonadota bacterium]MCA9768981.1 flagellin [Gemmatimonadota bacterium]HPF62771.1 flagellin [Gemmatimonadales bacterium]
MSVIQTNSAANSAYRNLSMTSSMLERQITKLSSGFRINRSADDAAGLAIANKLRAESRSLQQASRNAAQANSLLQIADGAVNTISGILDRMKELATASNSSTIGTQRDKLDAEFQALKAEINRIAATTQYQGSALVNGTLGNAVTGGTYAGQVALNGAASGTYTFASAAGVATLSSAAGAGQVTQTLAMPAGAGTYNFDRLGITVTNAAGYVADAANGQTIIVTGTAVAFQVSSSGSYAANDLVSFSSVNLTTAAAGLNIATLDVLSAANAQTALAALDTAIDASNTAIGTIGAAQSRIEFASANVATATQNVIAAESTIRDADMALESTAFAKYQILQQAGTAMLAQANASAQTVLNLLR